HRTRVARVALAVAVGVGLIRVRDVGAVVGRVRLAVMIAIVRIADRALRRVRVERARIASVADAVAVGVALLAAVDPGDRIEHVRTLVLRVRDAVAVAVGRARRAVVRRRAGDRDGPPRYARRLVQRLAALERRIDARAGRALQLRERLADLGHQTDAFAA